MKKQNKCKDGYCYDKELDDCIECREDTVLMNRKKNRIYKRRL